MSLFQNVNLIAASAQNGFVFLDLVLSASDDKEKVFVCRRRQLIVCIYIIGKWHPYFLQFKSLSCHRIYFAGQIFFNYLDDVRRSLSFMHAKKECVTISSLLVIPRLILNGLTHDLKKVRIMYVRALGGNQSLWVRRMKS